MRTRLVGEKKPRRRLEADISVATALPLRIEDAAAPTAITVISDGFMGGPLRIRPHVR